MLVTLLTLIALCGVCVVACRQYRLYQLREQVQQALPLPTHNASPELLSMAGLSTVELFWHWQQIDSQVISAADFSSRMDIQSGFDFARYIDQHVAGMDVESLAGFKHRLMGYVGEQRVAELLADQGYVVEVAETANQPIWDLLVDGQAVNVKTVADLADIKAVALAHPDVTYIVPMDARGELTDNMQRIEGFNHHQMSQATEQAIMDTSTTDALENIASHLPVIPFLFSVVRNQKAVQQGRDVGVAAQHVVLDTLGRGGGAGLGALIGGTAGAIAGPIGVAIGSVLGAMCGSMFGAHWVEELKKSPLKKAINVFEQHLQRFGAVYANRLQRVLHILNQPYFRQQQFLTLLEQQLKHRKQGIRWWVFPDFYTVLIEQTHCYAVQQLQQQKFRLSKIETQLNDAQQQGDHRPLGLVMLNVPHMRVNLGVDLIALRILEAKRERVYYERSQLHPDVFPPRKKSHAMSNVTAPTIPVA